MDINVIWWFGTILEATLFLRAVSTGLLGKYPLFYFYVGCVLATDLFRMCWFTFAPKYYSNLYWYTELFTIIASYAVLLEIFRKSLKDNPGVARLAHTLLLITFVLALSYAAADLLHGGLTALPRATADLGRDLRYLEAGQLLAMLWIFGRYRISVGRNLMGLIAGYSLWVGLNVINLALLFLSGHESSIVLRKILPVTFVIASSIWCVTLWVAKSEPIQPMENDLERDYGVIAAKTRSILVRTSNRVVKLVQP
jgi:hypothetical protein